MTEAPKVHPLKAWRASHHLSMGKFAARACIAQPYVAQLEGGIKVPSLAMAARLSRVTGLQMLDFLPAETLAQIDATYFPC